MLLAESEHILCLPGQIAATCTGEPGPEETFTIDIPKGGSIRGEYQLCRYLGQSAATGLAEMII